MDKKGDRDASIGGLLPGTLLERAAVETGRACLDAETLAAFADEALDARERAAAEAHAADCARCQALLAAMVKTLPPPGAAASPFRLPSLWWLLAMTPAAAALVIWFAVPGRAPVQQSESAEAAAERVAPVPSVARPEPSADARAKIQADAPPESTPGATREPSPLEKKAAPASSANARSEADTLTAQAQGAAPVPGPPSAAPATPPAGVSTREAVSVSAPARLSAFANPMDSVIVSSNPATRFRLLPGGGVQRSSDGGATWRTEVTGAPETLTAGASPSPSVCWLVGRTGIVLLSTDGRSWRRLAFPEAVDLRSVSAVDDENATVTAVDGRAFVTTDGGLTWSRPPGV